MGMFTWVKVDDELLPEEYRGLSGWQTKDVVNCTLETLHLKADGSLVYQWWEREFYETDESYFGFFLRPTIEHNDILDYHGDVTFYTFRDDKDYSSIVELTARYDDGKFRGLVPPSGAASG